MANGKYLKGKKGEDALCWLNFLITVGVLVLVIIIFVKEEKKK